MIEEERFYAWLDGELEDAEASEVAARVAEDPRLVRLAEQHRAFEAKLRGAFQTVTADPVPERLKRTLGPSEDVVEFPLWRRRVRSSTVSITRNWMSLAATLAIGIALGSVLDRRENAQPIQLDGGRLYAAAGLSQALDQQFASATQADVRIGLTFRDRAGSICRSFVNRQSSGLACRHRDRWQVRGVFPAPEGQHGDFRMAAGVDPNLAALIESALVGEPFNAEQEAGAKQQGWR